MTKPICRIGEIAVVAVWSGLVTGLVEGSGLLLFQRLKWLSWDMALTVVPVEMVWICPLFDLLLFSVGGVLVAAVSRLSPRVPCLGAAMALFVFMASADWLALTGRISHSSVAILAAGLATASARWLRTHETLAFSVCRNSVAWLGAAVLLVAVGMQGGSWFRERDAMAAVPSGQQGTPSVLVIVVDTLRADHLAAYGYPRTTSPNIDEIARQGVVFENAFAASSWTLPSHASLLTGRYPHEHGAELDGLDDRYRTLAEVMRERGYLTGAFSANTIYFTRSQGFGRGFVHFEDYLTSVADMAVRTLYGRKVEWFVLRRLFGLEDYAARKSASDITRSAVKWVQPKPGRPAFAFLNYFDPHDPYLPPVPFRRKFSQLRNPGGIVNSFMLRLRPKMTPEQLQGEIDAYDGAIAYADQQIGDLIRAVQQRENNMIVVITSDHGESFGEHGLFTHKNSLYADVLRFPLIVWWPGHVPGGVRISQPVANASLPATLLEMLDPEAEKIFPIPSLVPLWNGSNASSPWPLPLAEIARMPYAALKEFQIPAYYGAMKALVSEKEHYIVNETLVSCNCRN